MLFVVVWLRMPCGTFYSPDEGAKYLQMQGMGGNPLQPFRILYPGIGKDPEMFYYPARVESVVCSTRIYPFVDAEGRVQTNWLPWFPWITKPFYALLGPKGLYVIPLLAGLLALWLTGAVASVLEPGARRLALTAFALSSPLVFYSITFWEHTPGLVFQLAALFCALPTTAENKGGRIPMALRLIAAGGLLVMAIALRREAVFFAAALGCAIAMQNGPACRRQLVQWRIPILGGALATVVLLLALPPWLLPSRTGFDLSITLYRLTRWDLLSTLDSHFFDVFFLRREGSLLPAVLRWSGQVGLLICVVNCLWSRARRTGVFGVGVLLVLLPALFMVFTPIRYRALQSFALSAPFVLFALLPDPAKGRRSGSERLVRTVALLYALFYFWGTWPTHRGHGGLEWGSRYALILFSLLAAIGSVNVLRWFGSHRARNWKNAGMQALILLALLVGSVSVIRGVRELRTTRQDLGLIQDALSAKTSPIVTDCWWMATGLVDLFMQHELFTIASPDELHDWLATTGKGETSFVYASYDPIPEKTRLRDNGRLEPEAHEGVCGMGITTYRILPVAR